MYHILTTMTTNLDPFFTANLLFKGLTESRIRMIWAGKRLHSIQIALSKSGLTDSCPTTLHSHLLDLANQILFFLCLIANSRQVLILPHPHWRIARNMSRP